MGYFHRANTLVFVPIDRIRPFRWIWRWNRFNETYYAFLRTRRRVIENIANPLCVFAWRRSRRIFVDALTRHNTGRSCLLHTQPDWTKRVECVNRAYVRKYYFAFPFEHVSTFEVQRPSYRRIGLVVIEREEDAILRLALFLFFFFPFSSFFFFLSFRTVSKRWMIFGS